MTTDRHPAAIDTIDAEMYIDHVEAADEAEATVVVRCMVGPVLLGARFHQVRCADVEIDLELTRILFYRRDVDRLDPVCTAMVTLRGAGALRLRGRSTIQGSNPTRN
ncbi:hypothetical protein AB0I68_25355 [Streptomyces sp. NPDC050448]|uniref:hypothetical protein n=1 Tax=Streptomyces sp. NPDC050448 TaxID=3155404 RepID=UPI00341C0065